MVHGGSRFRFAKPSAEKFRAGFGTAKILRNIAFPGEIAKETPRGNGIMRAETQKVVEEIEQSFGLLRRSL
jgi:hypothetical protein